MTMWLCTVTQRLNNCKESIKFQIISSLPFSEVFVLFTLLKVETCQEKINQLGTDICLESFQWHLKGVV